MKYLIAEQKPVYRNRSAWHAMRDTEQLCRLRDHVTFTRVVSTEPAPCSSVNQLLRD